MKLLKNAPLLLLFVVIAFLGSKTHLTSFRAGLGGSSSAAAATTDITPTSSNTNSQHSSEKQQQQLQQYADKYNYTRRGMTTDICGNSPDFEEFFGLSGKQRSRLNEDKIVYEKFFKHNKRLQHAAGTYVELGAYDGVQESNTRFFDLCLGWEGLLIEGNPETYLKTLKARPHAHRISFAPSCKEPGTVQFYKYPMTNSGLEGLAKTYEGKPMVDVPCGPLGPVLEDVFDHQPINFFSLDVEGAEPLVLETIDFSKIRIDVLMIQVKNNHCQKICESRDRTREIMQKAGYKRYEGIVHASDIYVHPESEFQMTE